MQIEECYEVFGGDFLDVSGRIPKRGLIIRFVRKFLEDDSYQRLCSGLQAKDYAEAFQAAHSLRGVSRNLSFCRLSDSVGELTELLRHWDKTPDEARCARLFAQVQQDYEQIAVVIRQLEDENC